MNKNYTSRITYFLIMIMLSVASVFIFKDRFFDNYHEVDQFLIEHDFQGVVLIGKDGKILFNKGYGMANAEHLIPNSTNTVLG